MSTLTYHPQSTELGRRTRLDTPVAPQTPATTVSAGPVLASPAWIVRLLSGKRLLVASVAGALLAGAGWSWKQHGLGATSAPSHQYETTEKLVLHSVQRQSLPITITERGTLSSQKETRILCDLETVPGQPGTRILWLVPNGTAVKEGDLLVEFDSAPLKDRVNAQTVLFEQSRAAQIQASVRLENQKTQNETNLAAAKLKVEMAKLALKMYEDESGGTYKIALNDLESKIQEAKNQIKEAQAALKMKAARKHGVETLFKLGYRGKGDLDQAMHEHLSADFALVRSTNALGTAEANKQKLKQYEYPMKVLELTGTIATAERALSQVERDNEALLAQVGAAKTAADRAFATEEEKLQRFKDQLAKSKMLAPHDGLVAHSPDRTPWGRLVAEGELVTERAKILSLPDLTRMQVKLGIHESVVDQVRVGLPATIRIDAFPDVSYKGSVASVAVLPTQDSSLSSDVKVYDVVVTIDEEVTSLKPGMTAIADIHVRRLDDVVTLPVQAILQEEDATWCYVSTPGGVLRRPLKLGASNNAQVEVLEGLQPDDRVVLNPQAIHDADATHNLPGA